MPENKMSEIIKSSLEGIRGFTDMETVIGNAINTPSGVTVIPVSRLTVGFAGGGIDFGNKKPLNPQSFGSGSGSSVTITPVAFLTVGKNAEINLIKISPDECSAVEKITSVIDHSPEIIKKIKETFF